MTHAPSRRLPVTVLSGFLGAGKTPCSTTVLGTSRFDLERAQQAPGWIREAAPGVGLLTRVDP